MSSSQLLLTPSFFRGVYIRIPPTRYPPDFPTFNVAKIHQNSMSCWIFQLEPPWTNVSPVKVRLPDAEQRIQRDPQLLWRAKAKKNNKKHVSHWHCYWVNMALMLVEGGVNLMRRLEPQTEASQATFFSCFCPLKPHLDGRKAQRWLSLAFQQRPQHIRSGFC